MNEQLIPEAAAEAAMRAWGVTGEDQRKIVDCILKAAAPYLMDEAKANAWDAGSRVRRDEHGDLLADNPYRSAK